MQFEEFSMKVRLQVRKQGVPLYEATSDVCDADSFGRACGEIWTHLREERLARATSIGALFDELDERLLDELYGAEICLSKP
jgi:hypothetical protein